MMSKNLFRKELETLKPYVPGKPIEAVKKEFGLERIVKLASNENPLGPGLKAREAVAAADLRRLHQGERDTLHHFLNGAARFVILDDGKGVQVCRRYGIPHINALLCPKILHYSERLPDAQQVQSLFERIAGLGRYSKDVVAWARQCRRSDLDFFLNK